MLLKLGFKEGGTLGKPKPVIPKEDKSDAKCEITEKSEATEKNYREALREPI